MKKSWIRTMATLMAMVLTLVALPMTGVAEDDPLSFTFNSWSCGDAEADNQMEIWLENKLGIKIETIRLDQTQAEAVDLMLNTGGMPDAMWLGKPSAWMEEMGLIRTISEEMIRTYAPNLAALYDSDPVGWKLNMAENGEYLGLTSHVVEGDGTVIFLSSYRLDWLRNLGIEPNGEVIHVKDNIYFTTEPFTQSQFLEIMDGFVNGDPDGDGLNNTGGAAANNNTWLTYGMGTMNMFGICRHGSMDVDGVAEYYYATPQWKEYLKFMAEVYAAGYMDPAFATTERTESFEKIKAGQYGYIANASSTVGNGSVTSMDNMVPNHADILYVPQEVMDDGTGGIEAFQVTNYAKDRVLYVNRNVSDEKLATILRFIDFCHFDEEARLKLRYGNEGEHFDFDEEGYPVLKSDTKYGGTTGIWCYNSGYIVTLEDALLDFGYVAWTMASLLSDAARDIQVYPYRIDLLNETNYADLQTKYDSNLQSIANQFAVNVICGNIDVDEGWDAYIAELEASGYDKIREELNNAPLYAEFAD